MTKAKTQICTLCNIEKSIREFNGYRNPKEIGGWNYDSACKICYPDKRCVRCNERKPFDEFRARKRNDKVVYEAVCIKCESSENKKRSKQRYDEKGRQEFLDKYYNDPDFKKKQAEYNKKWEQENTEKRRLYRKGQAQRKRANKWFQNKRQTDPAWKIRGLLSNQIGTKLKRNGGSKNGESSLNYLPYTIAELKEHLESHFDPWMSWKNHGRYNPETWDDNDPSTWTWQIDHIIPHSDLPYDSMEHPNFKKAWALENLRPLSSKQNLFDGTRRTRHNSASL